jgi:hypothetical protein
MITQPKKWPGYVLTAVLVIFAVNNPEKAADLVDQIVHAIVTFADRIG